MKKFLLSLALLTAFLTVYSQKRVPVLSDKAKIALTRHYQTERDVWMEPVNESAFSNLTGGLRPGSETEIIETVYDLQTNACLSNRFWVWDDGSMAAVCTRGMTPPNYPERGTGYNFGTLTGSTVNWGPKPTARIESLRTGWPSIAPWGPNGEIIVAHNFPVQLVINRRENKGTGPWTEILYPGPGGDVKPSWARVVTSGQGFKYLNMIYNTYNAYLGQTSAILYSRYNRDLQVWDIQDVLLEGTGSDYYLEIRADSYAMAARDNVVVILVASAWHDMFILKSTDSGETFTKTIIWEHPYPFFDFNTTLTTDTLYAVDNSAFPAIDQNGMVHVVWGIGRVARLASNPPQPGYYNYWPYTDGIGYWNESMGPIPEALNPHHTMKPEYLESLGMLIGWTQDVNNSGFIFDFEGTASPPFNTYRSLGISTMPTIAIDGNMILLAYASTTETFVTPDGTMNYKHIWIRPSFDLGQTWGVFTDLNADNIFHLYDECIYPQLASNTDPGGAFNLIYQADNIPGLLLDQDHDPVINRIIHNRLNWLVGIHPTETRPSQWTISELYPNPASDITFFTIQTSKPIFVKGELKNTAGQTILEIAREFVNPGIHSFSVNLKNVTPGMYFITITDGNSIASKKLLIH